MKKPAQIKVPLESLKKVVDCLLELHDNDDAYVACIKELEELHAKVKSEENKLK